MLQNYFHRKIIDKEEKHCRPWKKPSNLSFSSIPTVKIPQLIHHAHSIACFLFGFMIMADFPDHHFVMNFIFMLKLFLALFQGWSRELRKTINMPSIEGKGVRTHEDFGLFFIDIFC